jgi:hypothetical protein
MNLVSKDLRSAATGDPRSASAWAAAVAGFISQLHSVIDTQNAMIEDRAADGHYDRLPALAVRAGRTSGSSYRR